MSREMIDSEDIFAGKKTNLFSEKNHFRFATAKNVMHKCIKPSH